MFKRIIGAFVALSMIATPAMAGKFGGGSSFSSSRSSSFSSGSSYRPSTGYRSPPSYSTSRQAAAPRFSSGPSYNTSRPAQSTVVSRPVGSYGRNNTYVNNNYGGGGGGFASSFGGAFTGSIIGNAIFGGHHQAPVIVNGGGGYAQPGYVQGGVPVAYNSGPSFFGMLFWGLVNLLTLIALAALIFWLIRKFIFRK